MDEIARLPRLAGTWRQHCRVAGHRHALWLAGEADWGFTLASNLIQTFDAAGNTLWLSARAPDGQAGMPPGRARSVLGQERDLLIYDAYSGFDADAFGAAGGLLKGGGLLILLSPLPAEWPAFADPERERIAVYPWRAEHVGGRYLSRLVQILGHDPAVTLVTQGGDWPSVQPFDMPSSSWQPGQGSEDQRRAVAAIIDVTLGHDTQPLVLSADRGRGKSAALGMAAAKLRGPILVTAPSRETVATVFAHAGAGADLRFIAPDALLRDRPEASLLMVDEAAAIPPIQLAEMLERYPRIVFATTLHGYEGSGRGFDVRFQGLLDKRRPGWRKLLLNTPIRWAEGDPLEALVFRALMLDADPASNESMVDASVDTVEFETLDRDRLAGDEKTLRELFGLLVLAHYRTSPGDLRYLLDGPSLGVHALRHRGHIAAVALVAEEGGIAEPLASAIGAGYRRVRGQLIPQSLLVHRGLEGAGMPRCARVMRIAVHPCAQKRGLGSRLLAEIVRARSDVDYIGASFAASVPLLHFWRRAGCQPVRVGIRAGTRSGAPSLMMLNPLTDMGTALVAEARRRFQRDLPLELRDPLSGLDPDLVTALNPMNQEDTSLAPDAGDWRDLALFAHGRRPYEVSYAALRRLAPLSANPGALSVLDRKVGRAESWEEIARSQGLSGRAQVVDLLRQAVSKLLEEMGDDAVAEVERVRRELADNAAIHRREV